MTARPLPIMRGTSHTFSRSTARALLVSAAILAGAAFLPARAQASSSSMRSDGATTEGATTQSTGSPVPGSEETAFAPQRGSGPNGYAVPLPRPLKPSVAAHLRAIFAAQRASDFATAEQLSDHLDDDTLLGDILADRYLNPAYHPTAAQLRQWLHSFPSLADAPQILARLSAVSPRGTVPSQSFPQPLSPSTVADQTEAALDPLSHLIIRNPLLDHTVAERTGWGPNGARSALKLIAATPGMTPLYAAQLRAEIALAMLSSGEDALAYEIANTAFAQDGQLAFAGFVAGLAAWHRDMIDTAGHLFETASRAPIAQNEIRAASRFWAARARARVHDHRGYTAWMSRAAAAPGTFYGILATRALEAAHHPHGDAQTTLAASEPVPVLSEIDVDAVAATAQGARLFALLQVGETDRAEALLRRLWPDIKGDAALCRSVQLVAQEAGYRDLSEQIATILAARDGDLAHVSGFPMPQLKPRHGFRMDPALVYAMTRLESNFDARASSGAGAHGLMQIMPVTAAFVTAPHGAGARVIASPDIVDRLHVPAINLEIGQLYMLYLADLSRNARGTVEPPTGGDMVRMLASYNAGPSAISRWASIQTHIADPLMFIETLPNPETRNYVHRAFTYLWIYADKLDLPAPSLASLADAHWPAFSEETALAGRTVTLH
jgi:soluble lytic murein transglycosylase